jgi:glycerol-3-phosphate acyltransferase PlsX
VRANPDASIVQAARAVAGGRAQALVCAGGTGAALAAGLFNIKRTRGIYRPALALPMPFPGRTVTLLDVGANAAARREHLVQFAFMGAALASTVLGVEHPRVGLLANGEEAERGSELVLDTHRELSERASAGNGAFEFAGNVEGDDVLAGAVDVVVTDGFTGNVSLKLIEATSQTILRAIRDAAMSSPRAKLGGALLRSSLSSFRAEIDPELQGGAYLLGLRRLGVVPHGRFSRTGFAEAILRAERGAREDIIGRTELAPDEHVRPLAPARARSPCEGAVSTLTRDQVFALIKDHLADELDVEASAIGFDTRFKDDLEADSLDLYTLVQELEDTYGVSMSDEQAAQILTVGQAVDFVLAHAGAANGRP